MNCLAPGWIATEGVRHYWESLRSAERVARGVPSQLLTTDQVSEAVMRLAGDCLLAGRVLVWWCENAPRLVEWATEDTAISWSSDGRIRVVTAEECFTLSQVTNKAGNNE